MATKGVNPFAKKGDKDKDSKGKKPMFEKGKKPVFFAKGGGIESKGKTRGKMC